LVDLKGGPHGREGVDGKNRLKWILDEMDDRICVFFQWLKKEMSDGLL